MILPPSRSPPPRIRAAPAAAGRASVRTAIKTPQRRSRIGGLAVALALLAAGESAAQIRLEMEDETPTWRLRETDCPLPANSWSQQRVTTERHGGQRSEQFRFHTGHGTKILVAHELPPSFLIPELKLAVWVKATRRDVRAKLRVVLPHSPAPDGSGPLRFMIDGPALDTVGQWQRLEFNTPETPLADLFQQQLWMLRAKHGGEVNPREAYVDLMVLNLYTGPGGCDVWVDDVELDGAVSAHELASRTALRERPRLDAAVHPAAAQEPPADRWFHFDGNILELDGQPFFARAIQHNGEPLERLKELGFNVVELKAAATQEQLAEAARLELWLVCPPPAGIGLQPLDDPHRRVLAWSLGHELAGRDLERVAAVAGEIARAEVVAGRPSLAEVRSNWSDFVAPGRIVAAGSEIFGGSFSLQDYALWLRQKQELVGRTTPLWASIPSEIPAVVQTQHAALLDQLPPTPLDPAQLEFAVFEALAGGARGLRFLSRNRLDASDPVTTLRALTLRWLNRRLLQFEPWAAGGAVVGDLPLETRNLRVTALQTDRARLLLIRRATGWEQWAAGNPPLEKVAFVDVGASRSDRGYWLAPSGLTPLPFSDAHGGAQIEIDACPQLAAAVITESPVVVARLSAAYAAADGSSATQLRRELVRNWLAITQLLERQLARDQRGSAEIGGAVNQALGDLQRAEAQRQNQNPLTADADLERVGQQLAIARVAALRDARRPFLSRGASPLLVHPLLVPSHWRLAGQLADASWLPNALAGGDFENLQQMADNGWSNRRHDQPEIQTRVELSPTAALGGKLGLRLSAESAARSTNAVDATPVWITSGPISVQAGQVVRIHGWVKIDQPIAGSTDGLMIIDSLAGPALAERLAITQGWQEFALYRGVPNDGTLSLTIALTGLGSASIDEITVRAANLPRFAGQNIPSR